MSGLDSLMAIHALELAINTSGLASSDEVQKAVSELKSGLVGTMQFVVMSVNGMRLWSGDGFDDAIKAFNKEAASQNVVLVQVLCESTSAKQLPQ